MKTLKTNPFNTVKLKRLGLTYFVLHHGKNVCETHDYDQAKEYFNKLSELEWNDKQDYLEWLHNSSKTSNFQGVCLQ